MNSEDTTDLEATMTQSVKLKSSTCHSSTRAILCCVALSTASLIMGSSIVNRQKDSIFVPLSTPKDSRDLTVAPLTLKKRSHGEKKGSKYMQERRLKGPKVAWLMSFPNSGTSYTGQLVKEVTRETLATNYGSGNLNASGLSVPLYPDSVDGPFIADPKHKSLTMPQENEVVLTKTHCGGTCNQCHVTTYAISFETFLEKCLSGTKTLTIDGERQRENTRYSPEIVDRAIQVIRDPIDNIVSRFHLEVHEWKKANKEMQLPPYMEETREGFRLFCKEQHERYKGKQSKTELWRDIWKHPETKYLKNQEDGGVPCYSDFYRWVQWHNHAVTTTEYLGIPSYALHYEDFSTRFDETVSEIMEHMGKARIAPAPRFKTGKSYKEYFTEDELKKVKKAMKHLASENTWKIMERYFD